MNDDAYAHVRQVVLHRGPARMVATLEGPQQEEASKCVWWIMTIFHQELLHFIGLSGSWCPTALPKPRLWPGVSVAGTAAKHRPSGQGESRSHNGPIPLARRQLDQATTRSSARPQTLCPGQGATGSDTPTDRVAHDSPAVAERPSSTPPLPRQNDLWHARVPTDFIEAVFDVMADTPRHTYQLLTKRPRRLARMAQSLPWPANVWMGVTVERQEQAWRINELVKVPAAVRFVSAEPLLGPSATSEPGRTSSHRSLRKSHDDVAT